MSVNKGVRALFSGVLADITTLADYVYHGVFDSRRIRHMTKIWNDGISLRQLGWA